MFTFASSRLDKRESKLLTERHPLHGGTLGRPLMHRIGPSYEERNLSKDNPLRLPVFNSLLGR